MGVGIIPECYRFLFRPSWGGSQVRPLGTYASRPSRRALIPDFGLVRAAECHDLTH
jgi:hypothetical protein